MNSLLTFIVISLFYTTFGYMAKKEDKLAPWMGILLYKPDLAACKRYLLIIKYYEGIVIFTVVKPTVFAAAESEVQIRKHGKVMFENGNTTWNVGIIQRLIHPEYYKGSLNTIAIVFLDKVQNTELWNPIMLMDEVKTYSNLRKIFSIGYKERVSNGSLFLEQIKKPMKFIGASECKKFYVEEEINMESLWPPTTICFNVKGSKETCVSEAGMALATNLRNKWFLVGLSTNGPGCSLPGRFIEILPYVKWIRNYTESTKPARRTIKVDIVKVYPFIRDDSDEKYLKQIREDKEYMYTKYVNTTISIYGKPQTVEAAKALMFREHDIFKTMTPVAVGIHRFLLTDINYKTWHHISVYCQCSTMSYPYYNYYYNWQVTEETPQFGRQVPFRIRDQKGKAAMAIAKHREMNLRTIYMYFKFTYSYEAMLDIRYYGTYNGTDA